jgi:hypothetical protein
MEALDGIPVQGWHLAVFVGLPLVGTLVHVLRSRRAFEGAEQ